MFAVGIMANNPVEMQNAADELKKGWNIINIKIEAFDRTGIGQNSFVSLFVTDESDNIIGKLNIQSEDRDNFQIHSLALVKVVIDSVRASKINITEIKNDLLQYLNYNSYNQVFIKWKVSEIKTFDVKEILSLELKTHLKVYKNKFSWDETKEFFFEILMPKYPDTLNRK